MLATPAIFYTAGCYSGIERDLRSNRIALVIAIATLATVLAILSVLTKTSSDYSRLWMTYWFLVAAVLLSIYQNIVATAYRGGRARRVAALLCGDPKSIVLLLKRFDRDGQVLPRAILSTSDEEDVHKEYIEAFASRVHFLNRADENHWLQSLKEQTQNYDEIWLAMGKADFEAETSQISRATPLPLRLFPAETLSEVLHHPVNFYGSAANITLYDTPMDTYGRFLKTVLDKVGSIFAITLLSPILIAIAIAICAETGRPIFFAQDRHGISGRVFRVLKFRTMIPNSDDGRQACHNDERVTAVGKLIRRTSLDELPQLFNVLRGDMSLVGPRPHPLVLNERYMDDVEAFMQRHKIKPGITGWAQINGLRGVTETREKMAARIEHDLFYLEHWSISLDLKILLTTALFGWTGDNAK